MNAIGRSRYDGRSAGHTVSVTVRGFTSVLNRNRTLNLNPSHEGCPLFRLPANAGRWQRRRYPRSRSFHEEPRSRLRLGARLRSRAAATECVNGCPFLLDLVAGQFLVCLSVLFKLRLVVDVRLGHLERTKASRDIRFNVDHAVDLLQIASNRGGAAASRHVRDFQSDQREFCGRWFVRTTSSGWCRRLCCRHTANRSRRYAGGQQQKCSSVHVDTFTRQRMCGETEPSETLTDKEFRS